MMRLPVLALALLPALVDPTVAATAGEFTLLSMNVAGLPAILQGNDVPGDKATNAQTIGSLFARYGFDVIHMQEDFNYHAQIYSTDTHPYRTATSGGAGIGSGLNTVANFPWTSDFTRVKWATCSSASGSDCLTPKGFTFMRLSLADGVYIDLYNLHADAGTEADDISARTANLQQVAAYIGEWSTGNAVVVAGDTNSRYSRVGDVGIRDLLASQGLTDVWVQVERGGVIPSVESLCANPSTTDSCETVDKVLYRGSPLLNLSAVDFHYASDVMRQPNGDILSDHNPVLANFSWTAGETLRQSAFAGGPHGTWFSDVPVLATKTAPKVASLTFRGASRLDAVSATLEDGTVFTHGGTGGTASSLALGGDEYWISARLCWGQKDGQTRNFYIRAGTSAGRSVTAGTATADCADSAAPDGWHIVGFMGRGGDEVDQLAFVFAPQ